jgi:hypothetical protein
MRKAIGSSALVVGLLVGLLPATPAAAQIPSYISSMSDYQVRNLTGAFTPSNGKETMVSVTPSDMLNGTSISGVIAAWSGGFKAATGTRLYLTGGGHNDSSNNGLYAFEFSGGAQPTGWIMQDISAFSAVANCSSTYSDGRPTSIHTYDGLVFASAQNALLRFGGAWACTNGGMTAAAFKYNLGTNAWSSIGSVNIPGAGPGGSTYQAIYDPNSGKVLITAASIGNPMAQFYRVAANTWSGAISVTNLSTNGVGLDSSLAFDTTRGNRVLICGENSALFTVNWSAESVSASTWSSPLSGVGVSCVYDPGRDVYWIWGGGANGSWRTIYEVNAATLASTPHTLTGDTIQIERSDMVGSYGRFVFMPSYRAIGLTDTTVGAVSVIRLPAASLSQAVPVPPTSVQVR